MQLNISISPEAEEDISSAAGYYAERGEDLVAAFYDEVRFVLRKVRDNPGHFSPLRGEIRRASLRRFPYYIVFETVQDVIEVLRVLHNKQQRPVSFRDADD